MEEEGIGLVLGRATELRLKISNCIHTDTTLNSDDDDATQTLLNISDALQSLETQLSSLQVLQQQQRYEREIALTEIENSRKMLIDRLNEYKGKELEVILEASTFASETVEPNNEYHSHIPSVDKSARNGFITHDPMIENEQNHVDHEVKNPSKGLRFLVTLAAKTVFTIVGVVSILSLSGFGAKLSKFGIPFNVQGLHRRTENEKERPTTENEGGRPSTRCPPGRVSVVINGEARCLVKERVEIPFSAVATIPDINYGCG